MLMFIKLQEEEYEWGNPKAKNLPVVDGAEFGKPAYRWRKKQSVLLPSMKGIFKDFCIILKTNKSDSLRTLIEAGRGKVLDVDPKYVFFIALVDFYYHFESYFCEKKLIGRFHFDLYFSVKL